MEKCCHRNKDNILKFEKLETCKNIFDETKTIMDLANNYEN